MNEMPFPKPPPANHVPLEKWLRLSDRAESGREAFFRGRDDEYSMFRSAVMSLNDGFVGGGTMVFQGAPGAGKSALMAECMEAVRLHSTPGDPWIAVSILPGFLDTPLDVIEAMVDAARMESERLREMASGVAREKLDEVWDLGKKLGHELMERGGRVFGLSAGGRKEERGTIRRAFRGALPLLERFRIVVFVDEAQNVPVTDTTRVVLDILHRDPLGIPLVAAFFGLSDTQRVLGECGLSRLPVERVENLDPLAHEDAASAIDGSFGAYGFSGASEDRQRWVDSLAELSQGWPQHVNRVSVTAARVILEHGGRIEGGCLDEALGRGQELKDRYYQARLVAGSSRSWVYRDLALEAKARGGTLSIDEIELITEGLRNRTSQTLEDFLTRALHAGLLAPTRDIPDVYEIPIPSLGDHLRALDVRTPEEFRK